MEHLTKQQIVLLTLLVSFVTSLSTGIVTVSLMDQAPAGVTRTINQVIEKTIQQAAPQSASVGLVSISVDDQIASATAKVASSTVQIKPTNSDVVIGLGIIISKTGFIITDKSIINSNQSYVAVMADGTSMPLLFTPSTTTIQTLQINGATIPANISGTYSLGQKVFSLTGTSTQALGEGLITKMNVTSNDFITTSISGANSGAPLFDVQGNVIGIGIAGKFYPIAN